MLTFPGGRQAHYGVLLVDISSLPFVISIPLWEILVLAWGCHGVSSSLFQSASRSLSTRIPSFCHSFGDVATPSTISLRPSRFLQQRTTTCKAQDPQTGQEQRILGKGTHTHTRAARRSQNPKWCSTTRTYQMIQCISFQNSVYSNYFTLVASNL